MIIEYDRYAIASHFACAIENGDSSGLSDDEIEELECFLDTLPMGSLTWDWSEDEQFCKDKVTGLHSSCVEGVLYVDSATV